MPAITLSVGAKQYHLSSDDLQKHPGSLLATLATSMPSKEKQEYALVASNSAVAASADQEMPSSLDYSSPSTTLKFDTLDLPITHIPLTVAAEWLIGCYQQDHILSVVMKSMLQSCAASKAFKDLKSHDSAVHADLTKLLDFFSIPGPVTKWLPPIKSLRLSQSRLLAFMYTSYSLERAQAVVDDMMSYKPHEDTKQAAHAAVFVVLSDDSDTVPMAGLLVRALQNVPHDLVALITRSCAEGRSHIGTKHPSKANPTDDAEHGPFKVGTFNDNNNLDTTGLKTKLVTHVSRPNTCFLGSRADLQLGDLVTSSDVQLRVVGASHCELGDYIQAALCGALQGSDLSWGQGHITVGRYGTRVYVPVWALAW